VMPNTPQPPGAQPHHPPPPPPRHTPPSERHRVRLIVYDNFDRVPVQNGAQYEVAMSRMFLAYPEGVSNCEEVQVYGALKKQYEGVCQIAVIPKDQGLAVGARQPVSVTITPRSRAKIVSASFTVVVVPDGSPSAHSNPSLPLPWETGAPVEYARVAAEILSVLNPR
jgi:hypothetical protein